MIDTRSKGPYVCDAFANRRTCRVHARQRLLAIDLLTNVLHAIIFPATDLLAAQLLARESVVMQLYDALVHVSHVRPFLHEPT